MRIRLTVVAAAAVLCTAVLSLAGCEGILGLGSLTDAPPDASSDGSASSSASDSSTGSNQDHNAPAVTDGAAADSTTGEEGGSADAGPGPVPDGSAVDSSPGNCPTACPVKMNLNNPWAVTSDANRVYWVEFGSDQGTLDGVVASCPLAGCDSGEIVYSSTQINPRGVAVDGTNVYWTGASYGAANGGIFTCPITGCSGTPTRLANASIPFGVQVDSTYVYWTDNDDDTVMKIAKTSTNPAASLAVYDGGTDVIVEPGACVIDSTSIYVGDGNGGVYKMPLAGGEPVTFNSAQQGGLFGLTLDTTRLYYGQPGAIYSTLKSSAAAGDMIASDVYWPQGLAIDSTTGFVYWANSGSGNVNVNDGTVGRVLVDGGSEKILASSQASSRSVTVAGNSIFWVNLGTYVNNSTATGNTPNTGSLNRVNK
jgi:hypothetical protein